MNFLHLAEEVKKYMIPDVTYLISLFIAGIIGGFAKFIYDFWGGQIAWRRELQANTRTKIEHEAPSYRLMSTYAELFSSSVNKYLKIKSSLQMMSIQPVENYRPDKYRSPSRLSREDLKYSPKFNPVYSSHLDKAEVIAKMSLFNAGKLLIIQSKHFLKDGGDYFFPDWWAVDSIEDFHHAIYNTLPFDPALLLKYIEEKDEPHDFYNRLEESCKKDLVDLYQNYKYWLFFEDLGVRELSHYAEAYDNLFDQQLDKFYRIWFERRNKLLELRPKKNIKTRSPEDDANTYLELKHETLSLIEIFNKNKEDVKKKWENLKLSELKDDSMLIEMNSLFNTGWKNYCREEYKLAFDLQTSALKMLEKWYSKSKDNSRVRQVYRTKKAKIYNAMGNICTNTGIVKTNECLTEKAKACFECAELNYKNAVKYNRKHHLIHLNFGILYKRMAKMYYSSKNVEELKKGCQSCDKAIEEYKESINTYHYDYERYRHLSNKYQDIAYLYCYIGRAYLLKIELSKKLKGICENFLEKSCTAKTEGETPYGEYFEGEVNTNFKKCIENYRHAISLKPAEYIFYKDLSQIYNDYPELEPKSKKLAHHYHCKCIIKIYESMDSITSPKTSNFYNNALFDCCSRLNTPDIPALDGPYYRECGKAKKICQNML